MIKHKQTFKAMLKSLGSMTLAVVLAVLMAFAPALSVSAAVGTISTITPGQSERLSWSSAVDESYLKLKPSQNGFYSLTVTDYKKTGSVEIYIYDITNEFYVGSINAYIGSSPYKSECIYMVAGHTYELSCSYYDDDYNCINADISILFSKENPSISTIPTGTASSSSLILALQDGESQWLQYKTGSASGDYSLNYSSYAFDAYVEVYNSVTGENVDGRWSGYYDISLEDWVICDKMIFALEKNTTYYFYIGADKDFSTKLAISKNSKNVKNITINSCIYDVYFDWSTDDIDDTCFDYKVAYTDGSSSKMSYESLSKSGLATPYVYYNGDTVEVEDETWLVAGKQPVISYYNGIESYSVVDVISLTDYCSDLDATVPDESNYVEYEDHEYHTYYRRVVVDKTGTYTIQSYEYDMFKDHLSDWKITIVDERNNIVVSNNSSWPLVAGRNYGMIFTYCYKSSSYSNVEWWFNKEKDTLFPDTAKGAWYMDAVTYAVGRGILKGYANGKFGTADGIQRQDFLVMLARLDGVDLDEYMNDHGNFKDVPANSYYEAAVNWGYENGIVTGYQNGKFGVGDKITREQIVTFLYRYAGYKGIDVSYLSSTLSSVRNKYADYKLVSDYAQDPVLWAIEKGVIKGKTATQIVPHGSAQRCEVAQIMYNIFINEIF